MAYSKKAKGEDADILAEAKQCFEQAQEAEERNRQTALADMEFALLDDQWPEKIRKQREREGRPVLTINKLPTHIKQVVNDARQNKPSIKVHPVDSNADPDTAAILDGLIRNIEYSSNADVAYDTAVECAITGGFGYIRVGMDFAYDDAFDMDIMIHRVSNPFSIYGDPNAREADSSDWYKAFVIDRMSQDEFESQWGGKAQVDWNDDAWSLVDTTWRDDDTVTVAEYWVREDVDRPIVMLSDGTILEREDMEREDVQMLLQAGIVQVARERMAKSSRVKQCFMSGVEILEKRDWPGRWIPIVPVYGEEFDIEGRRYFRSLIHRAIDAQSMFNYWRTASTELVALAPRVPYIGRKGAFDHDIERWNTANTESHPFLEYSGETPPARQPLDSGVAAGALQEALNASDDIKSIIGQYDASLGARSNETSGRAIMARQREGDVSTFHFIDNMSRAIRHTGRILIDLIPKVYSDARIVRIIGEDDKERAVQINQEFPQTDPRTGQPMMDEQGQAIMKMHDLTAGKYDLTVKTGPSFTTRREEAAAQMTELIRAFPDAAPIVGPELAKNLDWPGADKIAEKMEAAQQAGDPQQVQKQMQEMGGQLQKLQQENQKLKQDKSDKILEIQTEAQLEQMKIESEEKIALAKAQSQQQIEFYKAQSQAEIAAQKAADARDIAAQKAQQQPQKNGRDNG